LAVEQLWEIDWFALLGRAVYEESVT